MRDDAPTPPTLAQVAGYGVDIFCWCNRCSHHAVLPVAVLIAHCGPALPFPHVHGRLRCEACGSKDIHARPNWKGLGVVAKHGASNIDIDRGSAISEQISQGAAQPSLKETI